MSDEHGHLPFMPMLNPHQKVEITVMAKDKEGCICRKPSPFLAGKIRFLDDDIVTSPLRPEEWGL